MACHGLMTMKKLELYKEAIACALANLDTAPTPKPVAE
jgi:hypothetical protein